MSNKQTRYSPASLTVYTVHKLLHHVSASIRVYLMVQIVQ